MGRSPQIVEPQSCSLPRPGFLGSTLVKRRSLLGSPNCLTLSMQSSIKATLLGGGVVVEELRSVVGPELGPQTALLKIHHVSRRRFVFFCREIKLLLEISDQIK